ncbi:ABC transporter ATP-binding protein [Peptoniphilus sp.]|uniref:ABC transporter ATP-binding protein n=1 Tax=Peptoniphilus sp. TaxID=1971214 RepID=UPI002A824E7F|nr:ABC transporter ATP-binding protein [Peptoniphilus sp.]MDY3902207.1 ABC transporter ATP-binding protein [Peptoniphilus sp.]
MMDKTILEVKNLNKEFKINGGEVLRAVKDISFDLKTSHTLGIVGESGSGKSTLARCIMGLYPDAKGEIIYNGKNILKENQRELKEYRKKVQMIFQDPYSSLNPRKKCKDIIASGIRNLVGERDKNKIHKKVMETMEICGLSEYHAERYPHEFSGGQRQRISIARALAVDPKIIVADEPTSALDVSIQAQIINLMEDLQRDLGLSMIFISHDLSVVRHVAEEVLVMYHGECVEYNKSEEIFKNPREDYTKKLLASVPGKNLAEFEDV